MCTYETVVRFHFPSAITILLHVKKDLEDRTVSISYQINDGNGNIVMVDDVNVVFPLDSDLPQFELMVSEA
jgi:hypothetical protein